MLELVSSTIILIFCLVAFAAIHSFLASLPFKRRIMRVLGSRAETLYMPVYSLIAIITILPLVYLLYTNPGPFLYIVPSPWRWLMVGVQLAAALVAPRALQDAPHRFKIGAQLADPNSNNSESLNIQGIYRWVRDPFLLTGLIIIWFTPFMTVNLLVIYLLASIYLYLGSLHWETRLVAQFGEEYRKYQQRVHRIIPGKSEYY